MTEHIDKQSFETEADREKRAKKCFPSCPFRMGELAPILLRCVPLLKCLQVFCLCSSISLSVPFFLLPPSSQFLSLVLCPVLFLALSVSSSLKVHIKIPALIPTTTLLNLWYGSVPPLALQRAFTWPRNILYNATFYQNQTA